MKSKITFEHIFRATSNGVLVTDAWGKIVHLNGKAETILQLSAPEVTERHVNSIVPEMGQAIFSSLQTQSPILGRHIIADDYSVIANITPIQEKRKTIGAVCNFQEQLLFEQSARELESYSMLNKQLKAIFHSVSDAIWVCDGQGVVIDINQASEKINAVQAKDVIGKKVEDLIQAGMFDQSVTSQVLKTKQQVTIVQRIMKSGRDVLATGTPVFNQKGEISLVVINSRDVTQLNQIQEALKTSRLETEKLKETLMELRFSEREDQKIVAENKKMQTLLSVAFKLANLDVSNILILGESGAGKGLLAQFIHQHGKRGDQPFIQINCAALPENLLEAELFGYEKGAFTGAQEQGKIGLIELAQNGTLFLDEVGDLPLTLQAKILKYLDDRKVLRIGGLAPVTTNCTVVAATNRNLQQRVGSGQFRKDLFYRLNTFTLHIPPLRDRPEDITALIHLFLKRYNETYHMKKKIRAAGLKALKSHTFPGNVRELKSIIKNAVVMCDEPAIDDFVQEELKSAAPLIIQRPTRQSFESLSKEVENLEKQILIAARKQHGGTRAMAEQLGISQATVVRKMKKHGISATIDA